MTDANYTLLEKLTEWAAGRGHTPGEAASAWLLAHPEVCSVISGVTRQDQLIENAKAADWALTPAEVQELNLLLGGTQ